MKIQEGINLYDVQAYDADENIVDPTRGEYVLASSEKDAIEQAEDLAFEQGLDLHDFFIAGME